MNLLCKILGHKQYATTVWLGQDRPYSVKVCKCKRWNCDDMEDRE